MISFCSGLIANAQLDKGVWMIGGSGSLYSYSHNYKTSFPNVHSNYTDIDLSASVGYFFIDKLSAGLRPYFNSHTGYSPHSNEDRNAFTIGPFVRYYWLKPERQFNLLTEASYQMGINKWTGGRHDVGKYNIFSLMAGAEIFINSTIGTEILIGYKNQITSINNSQNGAVEMYSNRKGIQMAIGFQFHLEKK